MLRFRWLKVGLPLFLCLFSVHAGGRVDAVQIVGSDSFAPFSGQVVDRLLKRSDFARPRFRPMETSLAFARFCAGQAQSQVDIAYATRRITAAEFDRCRANGIADIVEVRVGYTATVLAGSKEMPVMFLGRDDLFRALAGEVPGQAGDLQLTANHHATWKSVNAALPGRAIRVLGPPADSDAYAVFMRLAMQPGCRQVALDDLERMNLAAFRDACRGLRDDEAYMASTDNAEVMVAKLLENPQALAISSFAFLEQNRDSLHAMALDGVLPTRASIGDGSYALSRPLLLYVNKASIGRRPGLRAFLAEFFGEQAWGEAGYLAAAGLVGLSSDERRHYARMVAESVSMTRP